MTPTTEYRIIPLTQGQVTIVDTADYEWLNQWKWYAQWCPSTKSYYAVRSQAINGKRAAIRMHREILGLLVEDKRHGDHIDHDTLNNTRKNLRVSTHSENMRNRKTFRTNTSGIKGVRFQKADNIWVSRIKVDGRVIHLGSCVTKDEAEKLRKDAEIKYFGEFKYVGL